MTHTITFPPFVNTLLDFLWRAGFEAYPVGGCVRDICLGLEPHDWDVCTSALPTDVLALFPFAHPTGIKHGTVTVVIEGVPIEVTTFRSEACYTDHRHPEKVHFVKQLKTDLARRDFTINAMALSPKGEIIDPFGGMRDIERGLIRCVGKPEKRFDEDALRILRAFRFAARFGFDIDRLTLSAMLDCAPLTHYLSPERIQAEVTKMLLSPHPEVVAFLLSSGILAPYTDAKHIEFQMYCKLQNLKPDASLRWCALAMIFCCKDETFLKSLKLDNRKVALFKACLELSACEVPQSKTQLKHLLSRYGEESCLCYAQIYDEFYTGALEDAFLSIIEAQECYSIKALNINGKELAALGISGRDIGTCLNALLSHIIEKPEENNLIQLQGLAKNWRTQHA